MHENYDLTHIEHSTCMPKGLLNQKTEMVMSMCSVYFCVVRTTDTLPGKARCGIASILCYVDRRRIMLEGRSRTQLYNHQSAN